MSEPLRDTIANAYDTVTANEANQAPVEGVQDAVIPAEANTDAPVEKPSRTDGRARDEKGRLLPGKPEREKLIEAGVIKPAPETPLKPNAPFKLNEKLANGWKKEIFPVLEKIDRGLPLTPEERTQFAEANYWRVGEFSKGVGAYKAEVDNVRPMIEAMAQFEPELRANNIKPEQWITNLGNAHRSLAKGTPEQKLSMFLKLAQDYQVPVQNLFKHGQDGQIYFNPQVQPYQQQPAPQQDVSEVVKKVLLEQSTAQEIQTFATATDDKGQLKHPHFETVKATMQGLLQAELATDIADAYNQAIRHPRHSDIAAQIREHELKAELEKKAQDQAKAIQRARSQNLSVKGSTPNVSGEAKPKGVRASIEAAYDSVVGDGRV